MAQEIYLQAGGAPRIERQAAFQPSDQSYGRLINARTKRSPGFRVPGYLPFPKPLSNSGMAVPNQQSVDWPQAQLAPKYFPPGSPSTMPFRYPDFRNAKVYDIHQYAQPSSGSVTPGAPGTYSGLFEGEAEENPFIATLNVTGLLWMAGAGVLGYYTAKKGWDKKVRAFIKSKI